MTTKKTASNPPEGIAELSYEQAREQLIDVVARLEAGGTGLEESLALWERGEALARHCENWLDGVQEKLDAAKERVEEDAAQKNSSND
ncbi:exodeoxyribonuclease VII small subunit [Acaricomes phytoseiuli]|uniref:exodeoxyribonuclease VII small subunit n=1 Tax=Acaricomes phytoseiuli TaxID=291968 RepID=UPI00036CA4EE|nr:exodeoxyribonuclease VII small subunit [Acaricomes phytoseiuli]MCW1250173.1 exodeoxyribonuclease VII small subunit [Acaricomes phytoseiuli]